MRTILTVWYKAGKGKSSTIREFAFALINTFPIHQIIYSDTNPFNPTGDFRLIIKINGKIIAIESKGNTSSGLKERLDEISKKYNPDVIVCASRTSLQTVTHIDSFAAKNNYQQIWASTSLMDNHDDQVNKLKAKLQSLNLI